MTTDTGRVGRAECCTHMAYLAGNIHMCSVEYKSGAEVVKRFLCHRGQMEQQETEQNEYQHPLPIESANAVVFGSPSRKNHGSDLTSLKD